MISIIGIFLIVIGILFGMAAIREEKEKSYYQGFCAGFNSAQEMRGKG